MSEEYIISAKNVLIFYKTRNIQPSLKLKARHTQMPLVLRKVFLLHDHPQNPHVLCDNGDPNPVMASVSRSDVWSKVKPEIGDSKGLCEMRPERGTQAPGTLP